MRSLLVFSLLLSLCCSPSLQQEEEDAAAPTTEPAPGAAESGESSAELAGDASVSMEEDSDMEEMEDEGKITIRTILGTITGLRSTNEMDGTIYKYLGIPYAQPPVGPLRFQPPQPVVASGDIDATKMGSSCVQAKNPLLPDAVSAEDCLYLNVYSTVDPRTRAYAPRPVLFWIHGGAFIYGSGTEYNPVPLMKEDVIVVTINYRLGALGFMTFGNELVSGNMGLRDQILALQWVKRNIQYFGGDPERITIFGESAGGISAHALQLSPQAAGLMSGVILQSGTMLMLKTDPAVSNEQVSALELAEAINCSSSALDEEMLDCLQAATAEEILQALPITDNDMPWAPVVDHYSPDPVLPLNPLQAMKTGRFNKVPTITGTLEKEGGLMVQTEAEFSRNWQKRGPAMIAVSGSQHTNEFSPTDKAVANIMLKYYMAGSLDPFSNMDGFINMITDTYFLSPDQKVSELMSPHVHLYNFQFSYKGPQSFLPLFLSMNNITEEKAASLAGQTPTHADDLIYLFNILEERNEEEEAMSAVMTKYWSNFAKYGVPNHLIEDNLPIWKTYAPTNKVYLDLNLEPSMKKNVEFERMLLWDNLVWKPRERALDRKLMDSLNAFYPL